ncbi:hypothetical protein V8O11_11735 [Erwinia aphidicola]|uniref:hypothetical protein n=1 Tax=Erwinia aphidicola TaxID=68334 RepID=UPI00300D58D1
MKLLIVLIVIMTTSIIGLFIVGIIFYVSIEVFFYFYGGIPISLEFYQFKKIIYMSVVGGGFFGCGITLLRFFKVKGF